MANLNVSEALDFGERFAELVQKEVQARLGEIVDPLFQLLRQSGVKQEDAEAWMADIPQEVFNKILRDAIERVSKYAVAIGR